jgi:hypothetical protein
VRHAPLAQAFVAYWMVAVLASPAAQVALGRGESARLGWIALGTAGVNLAVSLALIRTYGIAGVVAGTLVAYALALPAQAVWLFPRLGIVRRRFLREVVVPVYGVLVPLGVAWALVLARAPEPQGPLALAAWAAAVAGSCWAAHWFVSVEGRDRARMRAFMSALAGRAG